MPDVTNRKTRPWIVASLAIVSLVLCACALVAWASSYFVAGYVPLFQGERRSVYVGSGNGVIVLRHNAIVSPAQATLRHDEIVPGEAEAFTLSVQAGPKGQLAHVLIMPDEAFRFCWLVRPHAVGVPRITVFDATGRSVAVLARMDQLDISYWLPVVAFAVLPVWWYRRRAKLRASVGLCRTCGYDLRATPERCPECGAVPVPPAAPIA